MYPLTKFYGSSFPPLVSTETLKLCFAVIISYLIFYYLTRVGFVKSTIIFCFCLISGLVGERLFPNAGVLLGVLCFGFFTKFLGSSRRIRMKMWDVFALIACIDVVVLRLDYFPQDWIESGLFLLLFLFLAVLFSRKKSQSKLFEYFLLGYSFVQFFMEYFRENNSREIELWLGLSSTQIISLVVFSLVLLRAYLRRNREKVPVLKLSQLKINA